MMVMLAITVVFIIGAWKVFVKAGKPGWWLLLFLIPMVNIVIGLLVAIDLAKSFGQSAAFGVIPLFLLGGIGYLVLGFGNYRYVGPAAVARGAVA